VSFNKTEISGIEIIEANRFSNYVREKDKAGYRDLESWVAHFASSDIVSVIGFNEHGFAVYRHGLEECAE
jgi:hypothetical protein